MGYIHSLTFIENISIILFDLYSVFHDIFFTIISFPACYAAEFQPLETIKEGGISLEHVISCVPGVEITVSKGGVKVVQFQENRDQFYGEINFTFIIILFVYKFML